MSDNDPNSDNMTGKTCLEHALTKVRDGLCSPHDVEELLGPVDSAKKQLEQLIADRQREEDDYHRIGHSAGSDAVSPGNTRPAASGSTPPYAADIT